MTSDNKPEASGHVSCNDMADADRERAFTIDCSNCEAYIALAQKLKEVETDLATVQAKKELQWLSCESCNQLRDSLATAVEALEKNCGCGIYKRPGGPIKIQCWACEALAKIREKHGI